MRCKNCGTENPDGSRFCATCGKPLEQEEPAKNVAEQKEEAVQNAEEQKEEAVQNAEEQKEEVAQNTEETLTSTAETKSLIKRTEQVPDRSGMCGYRCSDRSRAFDIACKKNNRFEQVCHL